MENDHRKRGCESVAPLLPRWGAGRLGPNDEGSIREHLSGCDTCRDTLISEVDPTALFLELGREPLPGTHWTGFMEHLRGRLDREETDRRSGWRRFSGSLRYPRLAYVAAPLAMVLVLAATLFVLRPGPRDRVARVTPTEMIRSPYERPQAKPRQHVVEPASELPSRRFAIPFPARDAVDPPVLEEVESPGARVYRFTVGGPEDETPIYLVVDESIDF